MNRGIIAYYKASNKWSAINIPEIQENYDFTSIVVDKDAIWFGILEIGLGRYELRS